MSKDDSMGNNAGRKLKPVAKLRRKLKKAQEGSAAGTITLQIRLTGTLADGWRSLREAAEGMGLDDTGLLGHMMTLGVLRQVRTLQRLMQKEAQS
jgi:hypothetical protein